MKALRIFLFFFLSYSTYSQNGNFYGNVKFDNNEPAVSAFILLTGKDYYKETTSDLNGSFYFKNVPYGNYKIQFHTLNSKPKFVTFQLDSKRKKVDVLLNYVNNELDEVKIFSKTEETKKETKGFTVNVIKTKEASLRNIQTNELLNTTVGVKIRQNGGLGSEVNYSINGLSGNAVRIFIDGIPISTYGSSFSLNSIPPSMIKNIEVYKPELCNR
ncbi:TonB-dependent receptor plug domain-containing protein [Polaribacter cellanae]|uniref:TonB-dependent receptor plug domain-containing protein n=1 Tax=Polaribacter cellanae TaxID=2818493 RepID=A0A975CLZ6_9FLAO|nr:TonB-dependent receptor plug domain-containing protein [Polaribacter cellanae]QTE21532.1 TonB-dependent receptor plug domain-containing protein [Polaribacter cellanae]